MAAHPREASLLNLAGESVRASSFRVLLAFVVATLIVLALIRLWLTANPWTDFLAFYNAGQMVADGESARLYDQARLNERGAPHFLYAPLFAAAFLPLAALPFTAARVLWGLLSVAALLLVASLARRWAALSLPLLLLGIAAFFPLYIALILGQTSPLTLLLLGAVAWLQWQRGAAPGGSWQAGFLAGLNLYKPQLLLPLLFLWLRQRAWRALLGVAGAAVLVGGGSLLVSVPATLAFPAARDSLGTVVMGAVVGRQINPTLFTVAGPLVALLVALGATGLLLLLWRRRSTHYHHALLWLCPLLVTPYLGTYDLLLLLLPLSFLAVPLRTDRVLQAAVILLWIPITLMLRPEFRLLVPWAMLLLYATCAWRAWRA